MKKILLFLLKTMWIFCVVLVIPYRLRYSYSNNILHLVSVWLKLVILIYFILGFVLIILFRNKITKKWLRIVLILLYIIVFLIYFSLPGIVRWYYGLTNKCPIGYSYYPAYTFGFTPVCYTEYCSYSYGRNFGGDFICNLIGKKSAVNLGNECEYINGLGLTPADGSCG